MKAKKTKLMSEKAAVVLCRAAFMDVFTDSTMGLDALCDKVFGGDYIAMYNYVVSKGDKCTSISFPCCIADPEVCERLGGEGEKYESYLCEDMGGYTRQSALEHAFEINKTAIEMAFMNGLTAEDMGVEYD